MMSINEAKVLLRCQTPRSPSEILKLVKGEPGYTSIIYILRNYEARGILKKNTYDKKHRYVLTAELKDDTLEEINISLAQDTE